MARALKTKFTWNDHEFTKRFRFMGTRGKSVNFYVTDIDFEHVTLLKTVSSGKSTSVIVARSDIEGWLDKNFRETYSEYRIRYTEEERKRRGAEEREAAHAEALAFVEKVDAAVASGTIYNFIYRAIDEAVADEIEKYAEDRAYDETYGWIDDADG